MDRKGTVMIQKFFKKKKAIDSVNIETKRLDYKIVFKTGGFEAVMFIKEWKSAEDIAKATGYTSTIAARKKIIADIIITEIRIIFSIISHLRK